MEVPQRDVVHAVEDGGGHRGDAACGDVAFAVAGFAPGDEGVGEDDGAGAGGPAGQVRADLVHRRAQHVLVTGPPGSEVLLHEAWFEVREPVEGDRSVHVVEDGGAGAVVDLGAQVDASAFDEAGVDPQSARRVVVAADHDQRDLQGGEFLQGPVEEVDGVEGRNGPVEHVARDGDGVDVVLADGVQEESEEGTLLVDERYAVELAAEVPVGGVQ